MMIAIALFAVLHFYVSFHCADVIDSNMYVVVLQINIANKIMKPSPIQRTLSPNAPRLQYPLYGEYGFEQPVGKKKYSLKQSAIHQLIFNHLPPSVQHTKHQNPQKVRMLDYQASEYSQHLANSKLSSSRNNYSQIYSPEEFQKMQSQSTELNTHRSNTYDYQKQPVNKMGIPDLKQEDRRNEQAGSFSRNVSTLNDYERKKRWEEEKPLDSLDRLVGPHNRYNLMGSRERQKFLDEMVQLRSKNPTYLNSHLR